MASWRVAVAPPSGLTIGPVCGPPSCCGPAYTPADSRKGSPDNSRCSARWRRENRLPDGPQRHHAAVWSEPEQMVRALRCLAAGQATAPGLARFLLRLCGAPQHRHAPAPADAWQRRVTRRGSCLGSGGRAHPAAKGGHLVESRSTATPAAARRIAGWAWAASSCCATKSWWRCVPVALCRRKTMHACAGLCWPEW